MCEYYKFVDFEKINDKHEYCQDEIVKLCKFDKDDGTRDNILQDSIKNITTLDHFYYKLPFKQYDDDYTSSDDDYDGLLEDYKGKNKTIGYYDVATDKHKHVHTDISMYEYNLTEKLQCYSLKKIYRSNHEISNKLLLLYNDKQLMFITKFFNINLTKLEFSRNSTLVRHILLPLNEDRIYKLLMLLQNFIKQNKWNIFKLVKQVKFNTLFDDDDDKKRYMVGLSKDTNLFSFNETNNKYGTMTLDDYCEKYSMICISKFVTKMEICIDHLFLDTNCGGNQVKLDCKLSVKNLYVIPIKFLCNQCTTHGTAQSTMKDCNKYNFYKCWLMSKCDNNLLSFIPREIMNVIINAGVCASF
jgi:hypothetical protein